MEYGGGRFNYPGNNWDYVNEYERTDLRQDDRTFYSIATTIMNNVANEREKNGSYIADKAIAFLAPSMRLAFLDAANYRVQLLPTFAEPNEDDVMKLTRNVQKICQEITPESFGGIGRINGPSSPTVFPSTSGVRAHSPYIPAMKQNFPPSNTSPVYFSRNQLDEHNFIPQVSPDTKVQSGQNRQEATEKKRSRSKQQETNVSRPTKSKEKKKSSKEKEVVGTAVFIGDEDSTFNEKEIYKRSKQKHSDAKKRSTSPRRREKGVKNSYYNSTTVLNSDNNSDDNSSASSSTLSIKEIKKSLRSKASSRQAKELYSKLHRIRRKYTVASDEAEYVQEKSKVRQQLLEEMKCVMKMYSKATDEEVKAVCNRHMLELQHTLRKWSYGGGKEESKPSVVDVPQTQTLSSTLTGNHNITYSSPLTNHFSSDRFTGHLPPTEKSHLTNHFSSDRFTGHLPPTEKSQLTNHLSSDRFTDHLPPTDKSHLTNHFSSDRQRFTNNSHSEREVHYPERTATFSTSITSDSAVAPDYHRPSPIITTLPLQDDETHSPLTHDLLEEVQFSKALESHRSTPTLNNTSPKKSRKKVVRAGNNNNEVIIQVGSKETDDRIIIKVQSKGEEDQDGSYLEEEEEVYSEYNSVNRLSESSSRKPYSTSSSSLSKKTSRTKKHSNQITASSAKPSVRPKSRSDSSGIASWSKRKGSNIFSESGSYDDDIEEEISVEEDMDLKTEKSELHAASQELSMSEKSNQKELNDKLNTLIEKIEKLEESNVTTRSPSHSMSICESSSHKSTSSKKSRRNTGKESTVTPTGASTGGSTETTLNKVDTSASSNLVETVESNVSTPSVTKTHSSSVNGNSTNPSHKLQTPSVPSNLHVITEEIQQTSAMNSSSLVQPIPITPPTRSNNNSKGSSRSLSMTSSRTPYQSNLTPTHPTSNNNGQNSSLYEDSSIPYHDSQSNPSADPRVNHYNFSPTITPSKGTMGKGVKSASSRQNMKENNSSHSSPLPPPPPTHEDDYYHMPSSYSPHHYSNNHRVESPPSLKSQSLLHKKDGDNRRYELFDNRPFHDEPKQNQYPDPSYNSEMVSKEGIKGRVTNENSISSQTVSQSKEGQYFLFEDDEKSQGKQILPNERNHSPKRRIVKVEAPETLPEYFSFEAKLGDETFWVTVPAGGVKKGEIFSSHVHFTTLPESFSKGENKDGAEIDIELPIKNTSLAQNKEPLLSTNKNTVTVPIHEVSAAVKENATNSKKAIIIDVPYGRWRDNLCDCLVDGGDHPMLLNSFLCPQVALAQIMSRMHINAWGRKATHLKDRMKVRNVLLLTGLLMVINATAVYFIIRIIRIYDGLFTRQSITEILTLSIPVLILDVAMIVYFYTLLFKTRKIIRNMYDIPQNSCRVCADIYPSLCFTCCTLSQMGRHTAEYRTYRAMCCTDTGLPMHVECVNAMDSTRTVTVPSVVSDATSKESFTSV